jgi:acyl-CoA thioester hydrolase
MNQNGFRSQVLWSQIDGNLHLRHSAYADLAAQARIELLNKVGLDYKTIAGLKIGPILFREELIYLREVGLNDTVTVTTHLTRSTADSGRYSFQHVIFRGDGVKAALVNVDGAWMDVEHRKLTVLPEAFQARLAQIPKSDDYQLV